MIIEKYLNLILEAHFNERKEMKAFFVTEAEMAKENHVKTTTFFNKCFDAVLKIEADLQNQLSRDKFENKKKLQEAQNEKYVITTQKGTKVASKSSCKKIAKELTTIIQEMKINNYSFDTDTFSEGKYKEYITYFDIELIKQQICEAEKEFNSNILKTSTGKSKFEFTKENLRPMILLLAKMEGIEKPSTFLDVLLTEVKEFNDFEFECDFFLNIHQLCNENTPKFLNEANKKNITQWLSKSRIVSDVFNTTWSNLTSNQLDKIIIKAPVVRLFCSIIHQSDIIVRLEEESPEKFITRVCEKYGIIANPSRARQYYTDIMEVKKGDKQLNKITELIYPIIPVDVKDMIELFINKKIKSYA